MNYRGKILQMSVSGIKGPAAAYICTAHCDDGSVEVVPCAPGSEHKQVSSMPTHDECVCYVYDSWRDDDLIAEVRLRCQSRIKQWMAGDRANTCLFESLQRNLARLESLDGDQPVAVPTPDPQGSAAAERPNYVGKLVFIEFPLDSDAAYDSGEFIIVQQSDDSLYGVKTDGCLQGIFVGRIPFVAGDEAIKILACCDDDDFIREFCERLDDMTTEDYDHLECDMAETVARQLRRMIFGCPMAAEPVDDFFNLLGCCTGRTACCQE